MKVPLNWLKEYTEITLPAEELARKLTLAGFEVAEIIRSGGAWENIIIGEIKAISPHPNADRLHLATVDLGGEQETVVCGAPNLRIGDKIAFARPGARLINPHTGKTEELKPVKIRGVLSRGMICSEKELGISENHEGIMVLAPDTKVGIPLAEYLGNIVFDIEVTANRPDCLSIVGIAREIAALTGKKVHIAEPQYKETDKPISEYASVEIIAPDLCPRYCASLITGVKIKESPPWLQERLIACGQRPINNVVDVTNYVMLEYAQPLHSFDYDRLQGKQIIVRRAREGETLTTLDGVTRNLTADMLVIADARRAVALAGVMGGQNSEVTEGTTSILLEAASFAAASIHHTSRRLGLVSEASIRFERGISPELTIPALKHATQLIAELGGGKIARGIIDVYPARKENQPILLTPQRVRRVLGMEVTAEEITNTLTALGFVCEVEGEKISVRAPYWRSDIHEDVDLIEEVARIIGYDKIPTTMLATPIPRHNPAPHLALRKKIRQYLAGQGFCETINYSLIGLELLAEMTAEKKLPEVLPPRVTKPLTAEQEYLRPSLRGGLCSALAANRRHEDGGIRLFELGKVYRTRAGDLPEDTEMLCGILSGLRVAKSWLGADGMLDFYDAKGVVEGLFSALGIEVDFAPGSDAGLHPVRQAKIVLRREGREIDIGVVGEVHPRIADSFEITDPVGLFEVNLSCLLPYCQSERKFKPIPRFPGSIRDIALVVDEHVTNREVMGIIKGFPLVSEVTLFDVYTGKQVPPGKKSLAYRIVYQSPTRTLTDEEVNRLQEKILAKLASTLGASLRAP